ncbi:MAG: Ig-like domain-containing protein, partial [Acidobacteriota bacterium]|nr:Ig-like domain-containing protein [Acidobacteriota bacterium]
MSIKTFKRVHGFTLTALALLLWPALAFAQNTPFVRELVPSTAPIGARVMVTGRGLADPNVSVAFAGTSAPAVVVQRNDRYVEVVVPANANSGNVRVGVGSTLVREVAFTVASTPNYVVTTLAGGPRAQNEPLKHPWGAAVVLPRGDVAVADEQHNQIKVIAPNGTVSVLAGSGKQGFTNGKGTAAEFKNPRGIAFDAERNVLYVADSSNHAIRRVALDGTVTTIAGDGKQGAVNGTGATARFDTPHALTVGFDGAIYVADTKNSRIRKVTVEGVVTTFAGSGDRGDKIVDGASLTASFNEPRGIVAAGPDRFYVADTKNNAIRRIAGGQVTTVFASPRTGDDDDPPHVADGNPKVLNRPIGIGIDDAGDLIVADSENDFVRRISLRSEPATLVTIAGTGKNGWVDGDAATAQFKDPVGLTVAGAIYLGDEDNDALRRLCPQVRVTGLFVPSGALAAGTEVRVFGTGFVPGVTIVKFGDAVATDVTWISGTTLTAKLPQAVTGGSVSVTISSCGGTTEPAKFVVDNTPPVLKITNGGIALADGSVFRLPVTPVITAVDDFDAAPSISAKLNDQTFTSGTTVSADGSYILAATAEDSAGNRATMTVQFRIISSAPNVIALEKGNPFPAGFLFNRPVEIDLRINHPLATTHEAQIDGQPYTLKQQYAVEGTHQFTARVSDSLGNSATVGPLPFSIDLTAPVLTFTSHQDKQILTLKDAVLVGGSDDAVKVTVNGLDAAVDAASRTFTIPYSLLEGENTLTAIGTDAAGNSGSVKIALILDTRAPEVTVGATPACTRAETLEVRGTVTDPNIEKVVVKLGETSVDATRTDRSWTATLNLGGEGSKSIVIEAHDKLGHIATRQIAINVDRTAPALEITEGGSPFTAALVGQSVMPFIRATDADNAITFSATLDGNAFTSGTEVKSEGQHTLKVTAKDCAGNETSREHAFFIDLTPPVFLTFAPASGTRATQIPAALDGTVSDDAVEVRVKGISVPAANGRFRVPDVFTDGVNELALEVVDRVGHTGRANYTLGIRTSKPLVDIIEGGESLIDGTVYSRTVTPVVRVFEEGVTFTATLDGAPFTSGTAVSANGAHTIVATANDATYGTSNSTTRHFTIDRTGPVVKIVAPANGASIDAPRTDVRVTAGDAESVNVNGINATKQSDNTWLAANVLLEIGENILTASGRDSHGNVGSDSVTVTRGGVGPAIVLTFPPNNYITNRPKLDVIGRVLRPSSSVGVTVPPSSAVSAVVDPAGVFRLSGADLQEGEWTITAVATEGGQSTTASTRVIADFTPPVVRIFESGTELPDGAHFATQAALTATARDKGEPIAFTLTIDGAGAASPATVKTAGAHVVVVTARDLAGNATRVERTFYVGSEAGAGCRLEGFDPADGSTITAQKVELVGRTGGALGVKVNGIVAKISNGSFCVNVELPKEGANTVNIVCTDADGNPTGDPKTITLYRATNDPSVTITSPVEGLVTADRTITVTGTLGDGAVSVDLNGAPATITGSTWTATGVRLQDGINILSAHAKNAAGRTATASRRVTYLEDLPTVTITSPVSGFVTGASRVRVTGTWTNVVPSSLAVEGVAASVSATSSTDTTGTFVAENVPIAPAASTTIRISGRDRTGRVARAEVVVKNVSGMPLINITSPADNQTFGANAGTTFRVSGSYDAPLGSAVEVNGVPATLDTTAKTFVADVPFSTAPGGLTPVIARLTQPNGTDGAFDTIRVTKLTAAPKVLETFPAANAVEVDGGAMILVLFSQPMDRATTLDAFQLVPATGTPVSGVKYLDKDVLTFAPSAALTPGERYTIKVAAAATNLAGDALEAAVANSFYVTTTAPGTIPTLTVASGRICARTISVTGTAPAGTRIRLDYGTIYFTTTSAANGTFKYDVPLSGQQGFQIIRVRSVGADGSFSPAAELKLNVDCNGPHVVTAAYDRAKNQLTVLFSRDVKASTLTTGATGSLRLTVSGDDHNVGGTVAVSGSTATITPAENLGQSTFTLVVTRDVEDLQGQKLESVHTQLFEFGSGETLQPGYGLLSGEVYDATTGRPLAGAEITIEAPSAAFARGPRVASNAATQAVTMTTDAQGRYSKSFPEGAHTIRASANGYTTAWRQIIVPAGAGVIPIDIRLTRRGATANVTTGATTLTHGGENAVTRKAELQLPAGAVTSGVAVTLTSTGSQSLAGLLPLGWSPLAAAEISTSAATLGAAKLTFDVPETEIRNASQLLTAVRYDELRDEWHVVTPVVNILTNKATFDVAAPGAYALVYGDKAPRNTPPQAIAGAALRPAVDPCVNGACPDMVAKSFPLSPAVVLPNGSTVATLNIDASEKHLFPSGTAVQAYIDEDLRLSDGGRESVPPFATDLLLYRDLAGNVASAVFNLAPSPRAAEVPLQVGFDNIRVLPYPGRLDRGALVGPEGGRVPADDKVAVEIPTGATGVELRATASSIADAANLGPIAGYTIVGGLQLTLQHVEAPPTGDEASLIAPVELSIPARATFTIDGAQLPQNPQLILVQVIDQTSFGNRLFRLAAEMTQLDTSRWTTKSIDRNRLPVDGILTEGRYLLLAAQAPIAFAKGIVRTGAGAATANARVLTPTLGVADLSRLTGIFNVPVPAAPAAPFSLVPRAAGVGDGVTYTHPSEPAAGEVVNVADLPVVAQPPRVASTNPANGAKDVALSTAIEVQFEPGIETASVDASSITLYDSATNRAVAGRVSAIGSLGIRFTLPAGETLRAGTEYVATVAPTVRGTSGTPLAAAYAFRFTTVAALSNGEMNASLIRISVPDANGVSVITGAPGALPTGWIAIPVRRDRDFVTRYTATAGADKSFSLTIGTDPRDRIALSDAIDLRVLNNNGALAAMIPLTPFVIEPGRAFYASPRTAVTFQSKEGVTVTVPAGAFATATRIDVLPATTADFAAVPAFATELDFAAGVTLSFEGRALKPLEITLPNPSGSTRPRFLGILGQSTRGPRVMAVDMLYAVNGTLTTVRPPRTSATAAMRLGTNATAPTGITDPQQLLQRVVDPGSYAALDLKPPAGVSALADQPNFLWALLDMSWQEAEELFFQQNQSLFVGSTYTTEARGRLAIAVPANTKFTITGVSTATSLTTFEQTYNALPVGDPGVGVVLNVPNEDFNGPHPVFGTPFRVELAEAPPVDVEVESIRGIKLKLGSNQALTITGSTLPTSTKVSVLNVQSGEFVGPVSLPATLQNTKVGDRIVVTIDEKNVDPSTPVSVVFNEAIDVGGATDADEVSDYLKQHMTLKQLPAATTTSSPIDLLTHAKLRLDSGGRRVTLLLGAPLARGAEFELTLKREITDRSNNNLGLGQAGERDSSGGVSPVGQPHDITLRFSTRSPAGKLGAFNLRQKPGAEFGQIRELAQFENLLFVTALDGGILAYDLSDPAAMNDTGSAPPKPISIAPGRDSATYNPVTEYWTLQVDRHGRIITAGTTNMYGVLRT